MTPEAPAIDHVPEEEAYADDEDDEDDEAEPEGAEGDNVEDLEAA